MQLVISEPQSGEVSQVPNLRRQIQQLVMLQVQLSQLTTFCKMINNLVSIRTLIHP